jgi:hypothetical protein
MGNMRVAVQDKDTDPSFTNVSENKILAEQPAGVPGLHIHSFQNTRITSGGKFEVKTTGNNNFTSGADTNIQSTGMHVEKADKIHMNGPPTEAAESSEIADKVLKLIVHPNPLTAVEAGWKNLYQEGTVDSIMKRVPMHEPWLLHENQLPEFLTPKFTDREVE